MTNQMTGLEYLQQRYPHERWSDMDRHELRSEFHARLPVELDHGAWAVAVVGRQEWQRAGAIGDGCTSATAALVTRCQTRAEAEAIAAAANDLEPGVMPASGSSAWIFEALKYDCDDYLSDNVRKFGQRKIDRRIFRGV